jgi:hypothetical protein
LLRALGGHGVARTHLGDFVAVIDARTDGIGLPSFVRAEFQKFLRCGVLESRSPRAMPGDLPQRALELLARPVQVVRRLHPEPQFGSVAAEVTEPHCHLGGNRGRARKDVVQCLPRYAELARRLAYREAKRR